MEILFYTLMAISLILFGAYYYQAKKRRMLFEHWYMMLGIALLLFVSLRFEIFYWLVPGYIANLIIYPFIYTKASRKLLTWCSVLLGVGVGISGYLIASSDHILLITLFFTLISLVLYGFSVAVLLSAKCPDCGWYANYTKIHEEELSSERKLKHELHWRDGAPYEAEVRYVVETEVETTEMCPNCKKQFVRKWTKTKKEPVKTYYPDGEEKICGLCESFTEDRCKLKGEKLSFIEPVCDKYTYLKPTPRQSSSSQSGSIWDSGSSSSSSSSSNPGYCGHCGYYNDGICEHSWNKKTVQFLERGCNNFTY